MKIGKDWMIESDSLNVTLSKRIIVKATSDKPKHERWAVKGYYSNIKYALEALVDFEVAETGLTDLKAVSKKQDELYKLIKEAL